MDTITLDPNDRPWWGWLIVTAVQDGDLVTLHLVDVNFPHKYCVTSVNRSLVTNLRIL